jgi:hypothetical protein
LDEADRERRAGQPIVGAARDAVADDHREAAEHEHEADAHADPRRRGAERPPAAEDAERYKNEARPTAPNARPTTMTAPVKSRSRLTTPEISGAAAAGRRRRPASSRPAA